MKTDRFDKRLYHFLDRQLHERRRIVGVNDLDVLRQRLLQAVDGVAYGFSRVDCIRTRRKIDRHARRRMTVVGA